jgi:hypothetical protein
MKQVERRYYLACCFLVCCILRPWRWKLNFLPKRPLTFNGIQCVTSQKRELFMTIGVKSLGPASVLTVPPLQYKSATSHIQVPVVHLTTRSESVFTQRQIKGWLVNCVEKGKKHSWSKFRHFLQELKGNYELNLSQCGLCPRRGSKLTPSEYNSTINRKWFTCHAEPLQKWPWNVSCLCMQRHLASVSISFQPAWYRLQSGP